MFIGVYTLENKKYFSLYYDNIHGWNAWHSETFSPKIKDIKMLRFKIHGKTYQEKKASAQELAIRWQTIFSGYSWSYSEIIEITDYFQKIGKRYGLLEEFKNNCIL